MNPDPPELTAKTAAPSALRASAPTAINRTTARYDRPVLFYALATVIPWGLWFAAAYLSHLPEQTTAVQGWTAALGMAGLVAPVGVVAWLLRNRPELRADVWRRLLWRPDAPKRYIACAFLLLLASILAAQAVSLLFGHSADQFRLREGFSFTAGLLPVWMLLIVAPVLEELAWHSYGTDALLTRMRLFTASMVFVVVWTLWHLPLSLINGYYHSEVVESGWIQALNFPLSMIPFVLLMNWLYYRTGRSIAVAVVFHISAGFFNEIFMTHPDSKVIQTALLLIVTAVVVVRERELFFGTSQAQRAVKVAEMA